MPIPLLAVILGLVQAATEFLPVSSSAHLILARAALDFDVVDGLTFDVAVHIGTLIAVVAFFWKDLIALAQAFFASIAKRSLDAHPWSRLAWYVLAACVPAGIVGFLFEREIEVYFRNPIVIVVTLILGALLFLWADRRWKSEGEMNRLTLWTALGIGAAQTLALIPGVSRSGITIVTGMMAGLRRDQAARFSFLMASPLMLAAGLKKSLDLAGEPISSDERTALLVGIATSAIAGWLVIRFLMSFLRRHRLTVFAAYRILLAIVVAVFILT